MNRQKKKISHSSDDDQVSIFDSEEEQNKQSKKKQKNKHKQKDKDKPKSRLQNNNNNKSRLKRTTTKSREKKLSKEEEDIMKKLNGEVAEENSHTSTQSQKKKPNKFAENDQIRLQKQNVIKGHEEEDSNPYEQIGLQEYVELNYNESSEGNYSKNNVKSKTINKNGEYSVYTNNTVYNKNPYALQDYHRNTNANQYTPYQNNPIYFHQSYPEIDPQIELSFEDFLEDIHQDQKFGEIDINFNQIEQLKKQVDYQKKEENEEQKKKKDKKFKQQRKALILQEIQRLRKEYILLENQTQDHIQEQKVDNNILGPDDNNLLKQWKYDPSLLQKRQKIKPVQVKVQNQNPPKSKTEGRITMLNEVLAQNPFLTQVEMADVLRAMDPVMNARIERSVVLRLLKMCGFKKKKVRGISKQRNTPLSINLRYEYGMKYRYYLNQKFNCYYFDELVINQYFDKESGWCKAEGQVEFQPEKYIDRSVVILMVLSFDGVCKWDAKVGNYQPEEYCRTVNHLLKVSAEGVERRLLVTNPLPYRNPQYCAQIAKRRGWEMLVLPSDGLGLNPLQGYFGEVREIMKRKRYDTIQTLFESAVQVLIECDKSELGKKMLNRIDVYIEKAIRRQLL